MHHKTKFILLVILNILDIFSTVYFLEFNIFSEGNPLMAYLLDKFGYIGMLLPKIGFLSILGYSLASHDVKKSKIVNYSLWLLVIMYVFVVTWNIGSIILFYVY